MKAERWLTAAVVLLGVAACDFAGRESSADRADGAYRAAMADYSAGRLDDAVAGLGKVVSANPANASARFQLACLMQDHARDYLGAFANYREYLQQCPKSDKAPLAVKRMEQCERLFLPALMKKAEMGDSGAAMQENARLLADNARQADELKAAAEKLERALKRVDEYAAENERLRRLLADQAGDESTKQPTAPSDRELLDEDEDDAGRTSFSEDVARLRQDEQEETAATPFARTERKQPAVKDEKRCFDTPETYVVKEGDTLIDIANRFYLRKSAWKQIRDANKATVPVDGAVRAGQVIVLPKIAMPGQ